MTRPHWTKRIFSSTNLLICSLLVVVGVAIFTIWATNLSTLVDKRFTGQLWAIPSKVYSDTYALYPGMNALDRKLLHKLRRLSYTAANDPITHKGEYRITKDEVGEITSIEVFLNNFEYPNENFSGFPLEIKLQKGIIQSMRNIRTGEELSTVELEPELITEFFLGTREVRSVVKLKDVPPYLLNAIIAIEDQRFLEHEGIDPRGIMRAFVANLLAGGKVVQGGSTLTQQLVKNFFLTPKRSLKRKLTEAVMAVIVETKYSKERILELYVNEIYLGQRGNAEVHGVAEAAQFYFSKNLKSLTLSECALMAGLIRGPNYYNPFEHYGRTLGRRDLVLETMLKAGLIVDEEYGEALKNRPKLRQSFVINNSAPYFVDYLRYQLSELYDEEILGTEGLRIFTTLDSLTQDAAQDAVTNGIVQLENTYRHLRTPPEGPMPHWKGAVPPHWISEENILQGALIAIEPQTGHIKAMVGGREYSQTQLNRIYQSKRQPGSTFKPLTYITALADPKQRWNLYSKIMDEPFTYVYDNGRQSWTPHNYDAEYRGEITLIHALENSLNIPTAKLATEVGIPNIIDTARALGIESYLAPIPSLALGSTEVKPLELATMYSTIANSGIMATPLSIKQVTDKENKILEQRTVKLRPALSPQVAFLATYALENVINRGTGQRVRAMGFNRPAAGKTGTTNEFVDAWFAGFTPELCAVVWVGFDRERPLDLPGSSGAIPIWTTFMKDALEGYPISRFVVPRGIVFTKGAEGEPEVYYEGTEPEGSKIVKEGGEPGEKPGKPRSIFDLFGDIFK